MERTNAMEIAFLIEEETNAYYDSSRCNNGGGYSQPHYELAFTDGTLCHIYDESCGDFGSRIYVVLGDKRAYYGSMLELRDKYSDFDEKDEAYLSAIYETLGYSVPYRREIESLQEEADETYWLQRQEEEDEEYERSRASFRRQKALEKTIGIIQGDIKIVRCRKRAILREFVKREA